MLKAKLPAWSSLLFLLLGIANAKVTAGRADRCWRAGLGMGAGSEGLHAPAWLVACLAWAVWAWAVPPDAQGRGSRRGRGPPSKPPNPPLSPPFLPQTGQSDVKQFVSSITFAVFGLVSFYVVPMRQRGDTNT